GSATVIVPTFNMGFGSANYSNSAIVNTLNLNGGTLETNNIVNAFNGQDTNTVNFNGGTLVATVGSVDLVSGMTRAFVLAGGARINDGGNQIVMSQNLQSGASADGGLLKTGAGILTLTGTNTYNGSTSVPEGTLVIATAAALPDGSSLIVGNAGAFAS